MAKEDLTFALLPGLPHLTMLFMQVRVLSWTLLHLMMWHQTFAHLSLIFLDKQKNINPQSLHLVQILHNHRIRILITIEEGNPIKDKDAIKEKINLDVICVSNSVTGQSTAMNASTKTLYNLRGIQKIKIPTL